MSRWVVSARPGLVGGTDSPDGPLARVVKYAPVEVVSVYTMLFTSSALWPVDPTTLKWSTLGLMVLCLMVLCLVATFESPQMRVGSGGASSMPPQQRNSIEINAPGEWKP